jgi:hypothetical protein
VITENIIFLSLLLFAFFMWTSLLGLLITRKKTLHIEFYKLFLILIYLYIEVIIGMIYYFNIFDITVFRNIFSFGTLIVLILLFFWLKKFIEKSVYIAFSFVIMIMIFNRMFGIYFLDETIVFQLRILLSFLSILLSILIIMKAIIGTRVISKKMKTEKLF